MEEQDLKTFFTPETLRKLCAIGLIKARTEPEVAEVREFGNENTAAVLITRDGLRIPLTERELDHLNIARSKYAGAERRRDAPPIEIYKYRARPTADDPAGAALYNKFYSDADPRG